MNTNIETGENTPPRRGAKPFKGGLSSLRLETYEFNTGEFRAPVVKMGTLGIMQANLIYNPTSLIPEDSQSYFINKDGKLGIRETKELEADKKYNSLSVSLTSLAINDSNIKSVEGLDCLVWIDENHIFRSPMEYDGKGDFETIITFAKEDENPIDLYLEMDDELLKRVQIGFERAQEGGSDN